MKMETELAAKTSKKKEHFVNFMVTPCVSNIQHFNYQLMHTTLKSVALTKIF